MNWYLDSVCIYSEKLTRLATTKCQISMSILLFTGTLVIEIEMCKSHHFFPCLTILYGLEDLLFFSTNSYVYKAATHLTKSPNNSISELTWSGQYFNSCVGQPINNLKWLWRVPQGKWRTTIYYLLGRR